ncbi:MAG: potassium transporter TrkG [Bacillota bacterium]|nr:potassium transporter TrkG [Bacillota bacterium]
MEASYSRSESKIATGYRLVFGYLGIFVIMIGIITLLPLLFLIFYPSEWRCYASFMVTGFGAILIGAALYFGLIHKMEKGRLGRHQDAVVIVLVWASALLIGGFPYFLNQFFVNNLTDTVYITAASAYSYSEGVMENTSGYTTTGLTILKDFLDSAYTYASNAGYTGEAAQAYAQEYIAVNSSHIFLIYRSITHLFGGVGLILIVSSAFKDASGLRLYNTEGHGDQLLPSMAKTARLILVIYSGYIAFGTLLLWFFGMDWFDALNHSIAALATGGLTTRSTSMYFYLNADVSLVNFGMGFTADVTSSGVNFTATGLAQVFSPSFNAIGMEVSLCILMLLGSMAFFLHMLLLSGKIGKVIRDCEVKLVIFMFLIFVPLMMVSIAFNNEYYDELAVDGVGFWDCFRYAAFQFVTCLTTTGYSNVRSIVYLGQGALLISVVVMSVGGGSGSTSGAMKQYRVAVCLKQIYWDLKYRYMPRNFAYPRTVYYHGEHKKIGEQEYGEASFFVILYIGVLVAGGMCLSFLPNMAFQDGIYMFASALSSAGNSTIDFVAYAANNSAVAYNFLLWILTIGMYLGRLEIIPVYFTLYRFAKDATRREVA